MSKCKCDNRQLVKHEVYFYEHIDYLIIAVRSKMYNTICNI